MIRHEIEFISRVAWINNAIETAIRMDCPDEDRFRIQIAKVIYELKKLDCLLAEEYAEKYAENVA